MTIERKATNKVCRDCGHFMERQFTMGQFAKMVERLQCPACKRHTSWVPHDLSRGVEDAV